MPALHEPARGPIGRALDRLYDASAAIGAVAMVLLLAFVLLSIVSRQVGFNVAGRGCDPRQRSPAPALNFCNRLTRQPLEFEIGISDGFRRV